MENVNPKPVNTPVLNKVFIHNLNRIYFAKCYLNQKMPHLIELASFVALQQAMHEFWGDVKKQIVRMEEIYVIIDEMPSDKNCNPIKAIIKDEFCLTDKNDLSILNDMDVIMYMQMLEHINITSYRLLKTVSATLKNKEIEQLLIECFDESIDNDHLFVLIAKEYINAD
jgi:ferritin-like metal-binding protein YciE